MSELYFGKHRNVLNCDISRSGENQKNREMERPDTNFFKIRNGTGGNLGLEISSSLINRPERRMLNWKWS